MKRTFIYVDGFNLYYRALRNGPHKWLDLLTLCRALLDEDNAIEMINYYTAMISGKRDRFSFPAGGPLRNLSMSLRHRVGGVY